MNDKNFPLGSSLVLVLMLSTIFWWGGGHVYAQATSTPDNNGTSTPKLEMPIVFYPDQTPFIATSSPLLFSGTSTATSTLVANWGNEASSTTTDAEGNWSISIPLVANATTTYTFFAQVGDATSTATGVQVFWQNTSTTTDDNDGSGNETDPINDTAVKGGRGSSSSRSGDRNRPIETTAGLINPYLATTGSVVTSGQVEGMGQVLGVSTTFAFNSNLTVGSRGNDVMMLQTKLAQLGYFSVAPTGYFGSITRAAVTAFQKANNLPQTGYFGPMTRAVLNVLMQS